MESVPLTGLVTEDNIPQIGVKVQLIYYDGGLFIDLCYLHDRRIWKLPIHQPPSTRRKPGSVRFVAK